MAIQPTCDYCDEELTEPGALMFAPPNEFAMSRKWHLCVACWRKLLEMLHIH